MSNEMGIGTKKDDKEIEYVDILYFHRANFRKTALDNLLDLQQYLEKKKTEPTAMIMMQPNPQMPPRNVPIDEVIKSHQKGIKNAINYLKIIDSLIEVCEQGGDAMAKVFVEQMDADYESKIARATTGMPVLDKNGKPIEPMKK